MIPKLVPSFRLTPHLKPNASEANWLECFVEWDRAQCCWSCGAQVKATHNHNNKCNQSSTQGAKLRSERSGHAVPLRSAELGPALQAFSTAWEAGTALGLHCCPQDHAVALCLLSLPITASWEHRDEEEHSCKWEFLQRGSSNPH